MWKHNKVKQSMYNTLPFVLGEITICACICLFLQNWQADLKIYMWLFWLGKYWIYDSLGRTDTLTVLIHECRVSLHLYKYLRISAIFCSFQYTNMKHLLSRYPYIIFFNANISDILKFLIVASMKYNWFLYIDLVFSKFA